MELKVTLSGAHKSLRGRKYDYFLYYELHNHFCMGFMIYCSSPSFTSFIVNVCLTCIADSTIGQSGLESKSFDILDEYFAKTNT